MSKETKRSKTADEASLDELRDAIDSDRLTDPEVTPEPETEKTEAAPEPDQPDEQAEGGEAPLDESVEPEQTEVEPQGEAPRDHESQIADRIASLERQIEIEKIAREKSDAQAERWRLRSDQNSARAGNFLKQLQTSREQPQPRHEDLEDYSPEPDVRPAGAQEQPEPNLQHELNEIRAERRLTAMQNAQQELAADPSIQEFSRTFRDKFGEDEEKQFVQDFNSIVTEEGGDLKAALEYGSPSSAAKLYRSVLRSAIAEAKIRLLQRQEEKAAKAKTDQAERLRDKKKAAASVSTGATAAPRPKPASFAEMDVEKLRKLIDGAGAG